MDMATTEGGGLKQLPPVEGGLVGVEGAALTAGLGVATQGPKLGVWPLRQLWAWGQAERTFSPPCSPRDN